MAIEYMGLKQIEGPLIVLEGAKDLSYEEMVDVTMKDGSRRHGRVLKMNEDAAIIQVFEGTQGMSLSNTKTIPQGKPLEIGVSKEILGRTLNGSGRPIDGLGEVYPEKLIDVNGEPINPVARQYPKNFIQTGISAIDGLMTLIRGQKLPIFSGNGLPHAFADICIKRQMFSAIKTAKRHKHLPLNSYVSFSKPVYQEEADTIVSDMIATVDDGNPEKIIIDRESFAKIQDDIGKILSEFECRVLSLYLQGKTYQEIAGSLQKELKSIDNALQRIKKKLLVHLAQEQ